MTRRPLVLSALLIGITMIAGLAIRFTNVGLPAPIVKYGGSALWAMMIYWIASTVLPSLPVGRGALIAGSVATLVELFKLVHTPALDVFRRTLARALLLGRVFSLKDIAVYWIAIGIAVGIDLWLRRIAGDEQR